MVSGVGGAPDFRTGGPPVEGRHQSHRTAVLVWRRREVAYRAAPRQRAGIAAADGCRRCLHGERRSGSSRPLGARAGCGTHRDRVHASPCGSRKRGTRSPAGSEQRKTRRDRMRRSNKVIVSCAITGSIHTPSMSPHLPHHAGADCGRRRCSGRGRCCNPPPPCARPQTGRPTQDKEVYAQFLPRIRERCDAIVNITTGAGLGMSMDERLAAAKWAKPEIASMNMGSMNFNISGAAGRIREFKYEWEQPYLAGTTDFILSNTFAQIERGMRESSAISERASSSSAMTSGTSTIWRISSTADLASRRSSSNPSSASSAGSARAGEPSPYARDGRQAFRRRLLSLGSRRRTSPVSARDHGRDSRRQRPGRPRKTISISAAADWRRRMANRSPRCGAFSRNCRSRSRPRRGTRDAGDEGSGSRRVLSAVLHEMTRADPESGADQAGCTVAPTASLRGPIPSLRAAGEAIQTFSRCAAGWLRSARHDGAGAKDNHGTCRS